MRPYIRGRIVHFEMASGGQLETVMILNHPVIRLVFKAMSACGLIGARRDFAMSRGSLIEKKSPFVLVARTRDGRWGVFHRDFDNPQASFDEMQEACDHANGLATRTDSMVLIGKRRDSAADPDSSAAKGAI